MKTKFFFLAVAAVALASCSNDETVEVNQGNEISFRAFTSGVTRAADVTESNLQSFVVNAKVAGNETSYFDNVTFTATGTISGSNLSSGATYNSETKYYWPSSGSLDFYAYAPASNNQVTYTDYKTFEVEPSATVSSQVDLVYAATKGKSKEANASGVVLNFRHTGAKIVCQVKNSSTSLKFSVEGWKVGYLDTKGKFIFNTSNNTDTKNNAQLALGQWSENATQSVDNQYSSTFDAVSIEAKATSGDNQEHLTTLAGEMILVPQTINAATIYAHSSATAANDKLNGTFIAVKMKILNDANNAVIASDGSNTLWAIWPIGGTNNNFAWNPGKKYTYTIDLAGGGYFEQNQDETTVDEDLDPILEGAIIKFVNVTVDDWSDFDGDTSTDGTQPIAVQGGM